MAVPAKMCSFTLGRLQGITMRVFAPTITQVRTSVYNPHFLEPILDKKELAQPLQDNDVRRFRPIKAAKTEQVSSIFYDPLMQKFINRIMKKGKKYLARDILEKTFENIKHIQVEKYNKASSAEEKESIETDPVVIFKQAIENCKPVLITTRVVKGGVTYQVPVPCSPNYQLFCATKWLVENCRDKERKIPMHQKLAWELIDAYKNEGKSIRKKQERHKQCEANRAYAHFRW
ncbi:28S ribosomal protein S7, mitochondrial-like [Pomacea canaliculata]|uniref:28S ribosomal protein S7, mitochondrial-like n=1 Tax=Pomacea canaliculata TaxID=400727 RepID=UPI000D7332F9|nr:28S ribosomal protein S7, mitochondrial-like [Pomacea canaliculata]